MGVPAILWSIVRRFGRRAVRAAQGKDGRVGGPLLMDSCDVLCIDGNPDFYRAHAEVMGSVHGKVAAADVDKAIIAGIIERYERVIHRLGPKKVFLTIDGPPPFAKVEVQRRRRYQRTVLQTEERRIRESHGLAPAEVTWDTSQFTPGSEFMDKLHRALEGAVETGRFTRRIATPVEVMYSSQYTPGEGEHKWSPWLRSLEPSSVVLSSNDGDVLVLASQFPQHDVSVLTRLGSSQVLVSVNEWQHEVRKVLRLKGFDLGRLMRDYIFYMSLCGNDFVQGLPFTRSWDRKGFEVVADAYAAVLRKRRHHLVLEGGDDIVVAGGEATKAGQAPRRRGGGKGSKRASSQPTSTDAAGREGRVGHAATATGTGLTDPPTNHRVHVGFLTDMLRLLAKAEKEKMGDKSRRYRSTARNRRRGHDRRQGGGRGRGGAAKAGAAGAATPAVAGRQHHGDHGDHGNGNDDDDDDDDDQVAPRTPAELVAEDLQAFEHTPFYDPSHPAHHRYRDPFHRVDFRRQDYREQYYRTFFGAAVAGADGGVRAGGGAEAAEGAGGGGDGGAEVSVRATPGSLGADSTDTISIDTICADYLKSLVFCFRYYTDAVPSWSYAYPHRMAPLPSDLVKYLESSKADFPDESLDFAFDLGEPLRPLELQMVVLPPSTAVLPARLTDLMRTDQRIAPLYPDTFELDVLRGEKFIYSDPILPGITPADVDNVKAALYAAGLTDAEHERNCVLPDPLISTDLG